MKDDSKHAPPPSPSGQDRQKRAYTTPSITDYGSVSKLTQGTRTLNSDGASGGFRSPKP